MTRTLALLCAFGLGACAGKPVATLEAECGMDRQLFNQAWPCVRSGLATKKPADVAAQYRATGDVVAERVKAGQMTEAEARLAMARALKDANDATIARYDTSGSNPGPVVYQRVGSQTVIGY